MIFIAAFFIELLILFLLARAIIMHLSILFYRWGIGEGGVIHLLAILFLPGTFIHEFSHYLMCVILRVKVFGMSLLPKQIGERQIKMGSVEHEKVDLFRDLLVGAAPFIIGSLVLFTLLYFFTSHNLIGFNWLTFAAGLVAFEIGNTMFSSKKDMEGSLKFLLILVLLIGVAYLFGFRVSIEQLDQSIPSSLVSIIKQVSLFLLVPIILDLLIIAMLMVLQKLNNPRHF